MSRTRGHAQESQHKVIQRQPQSFNFFVSLFLSLATSSLSFFSNPSAGGFSLRMLLSAALSVKPNLNFQQGSIHVLIIQLGEELESSIMSS